MLIDLATDSAPSEIHADLCIVGTGAAGLSLARAFAETRFRVCLVESGGFDEPETQALYQGPVDGVPWLCNLDDCRLRQFGGTTSGDWGGGCTPLDDLDFSPRPWVPHAGWPIEKRELLPYYEQARATFELGPEDFEDPALLEQVISQLVAHPLSFDPAVLVSRYYLKSPVHFGEPHRRLHRAQNITLLLHANAVDLETNDTAEVLTGVRVQALSGRTAIVRACVFVLACGGIETPRLLLASNAVEPMVWAIATMWSAGFSWITRAVRAVRSSPMSRNALSRFTITLSTGTDACRSIRRFASPNRFNAAVACSTRDAGWSVTSRRRAGRRCCNTGNARSPSPPPDAGCLNPAVASDRRRFGPCCICRQRRLLRRGTGPMRLELEGVFEQAPKSDSRITLADERDALGQRRAKLDW